MGYVYGLLSALLFGANGSIAKLVLEAGITPAQLTFLRCIGAAALAALALLLTDRSGFRLPRRTLLGTAVLGLAGVALMQWSYAMAIQRLPVGIALLLEYLGVPVVALVAWLFLGDRVRGRLWVAIALVVGGLVVVAQPGAVPLDTWGVLAGLLAAVALASYFLIGERGVASTSPLAVAFWSLLFSAMFWGIFSGWWELDGAALQAELSGPAAGVPVWAGLVWVIALGSFAPYVLSYLAIRRLKATTAGVLAAAEVVFAFVLAWLWLGEALTALQTAGAALVLAGITVAQTARPGPPIDADLALVPATECAVGGRP